MNRVTFLLLACLVMAPVFTGAQETDRGNDLKVMTFNLRYASATGANNWPARRPVMAELFKTTSPDLIGTQEGLYPQLKDIASDLPDHAWVGLGREGGSRGEFMAVFYRRDRLDPLEYDHFWLSDTPAVIGSATWGNKVKRMVTWVRFLDKKTQQQFYFVNTHFDHQVEESRQKSAALVRQRIDALKTSLPILLVGDFNTGHNSESHSILTKDGGLLNGWTTAAKRNGDPIGTFHNYKGAIKDGVHIDWILHRNGVIVTEIEVLTFNKDGQYPSDHFPVLARLRMEPQKPQPIP
jgi:endonuclease/exonuclease/phosphatase family metal-dependent hydrolase